MIASIMIAVLLTNFQVNGHPGSHDDDAEIDYPIPDRYQLLYNSPGFDGDMLFPKVPEGRAVAMLGNTVKWPDGIVPYEFESGFSFAQETQIYQTMVKIEILLSINNNICIHFRPKNASDIYYIVFTNGNGCSAYVGRYTGLNFTRYVTLETPGCVDEAVVIHELLHALGFAHEQSRPDRDNYIRVNFSNIQTGKEGNFNSLNITRVNTFNTPYDYQSIMQYSDTAFSKNGLPTMTAILPNVTLGGRNMTIYDIQSVQEFYNCSASTAPLAAAPNYTLPNVFVVNTVASGTLTYSDPIYRRYYVLSSPYYHHVYSIVAPVTGYYSITSVSGIDTFGSLFYPAFNASAPFDNIKEYDNDGAGSGQFQIIMNMKANVQYLFVVTTYSVNRTGSYTLVVSGLNTVSLNRVYDSTDTSTDNSNSTDEATKRTITIAVATAIGSVIAIILVVTGIQIFCWLNNKTAPVKKITKP